MKDALPNSQSGGFTLIEVLVVLSIAMLVSYISVPLLRPPSAQVQLEVASRTLCSVLRTERSAAIKSALQTEVWFDVSDGTYRGRAGAEQRLPAGTTIIATVADHMRKAPNRAGIRFNPDGTSTGGELTLTLGNARQKHEVSWLTGVSQCGV